MVVKAWSSSRTYQKYQKSACKIILKNKYQEYNNALNSLDFKTLTERRQKLCEILAKCVLQMAPYHFQLLTKQSKLTPDTLTNRYFSITTQRGLKTVSNTQYVKIT